MFFSSATADYNMGERAKKGSPTSTLHDRHCCGILSWTDRALWGQLSFRHLEEASTRRNEKESSCKHWKKYNPVCTVFFLYQNLQIRRGNEKVSFFLPSSLHYSPSTSLALIGSENLLMRSNFLFHVKWMLSTRWHNPSEMVVPIFVDYE